MVDIEDIIVPEGFKVIVDPEYEEQENKIKLIAELQQRIANAKIPTDKELIALGKLYHQYYQDLVLLESLNGN